LPAAATTPRFLPRLALIGGEFKLQLLLRYANDALRSHNHLLLRPHNDSRSWSLLNNDPLRSLLLDNNPLRPLLLNNDALRRRKEPSHRTAADKQKLWRAGLGILEVRQRGLGYRWIALVNVIAGDRRHGAAGQKRDRAYRREDAAQASQVSLACHSKTPLSFQKK